MRYYYTIEVSTTNPLVGDEEYELQEIVSDFFSLDLNDGDKIVVDLVDSEG